MAIDFPDAPTNGQVFTVGDRSWTWNGTYWKQTPATGPQGTSAQREARSDWVSPYSYIGISAQGSSESASVWKVSRIAVSGSVVTVQRSSPIAWSDRLTATYT